MRELPSLYPNRAFTYYRHEGIERENVKTTKGVHWTPEELREFVKNFPPVDCSIKENK